nr:immunoglobulin light chain junction region [Macaca mulatta]MOY15566.1 immunoglobulin light chain junction region [Macaca mulatta]
DYYCQTWTTDIDVF